MNHNSALSLLLEYSSALLRCSTLEDVFHLAVTTSRERLSSRAASIFLFSKEGKLERRYMEGLMDLPPEVYERGQGLVGRAAGAADRFGEPHLSVDVSQDPRIQEDPVTRRYVEEYNRTVLAQTGRDEPTKTALAVPLNGLNRTFGVLCLIDKVDPATRHLLPKSFTEMDRDWLILLARLTANAIYSIRKQEQLATLKEFHLNEEETEKAFLTRVAKTLTGRHSVYSACVIHVLNQESERLEIFSHSQNFRRIPNVKKKDVWISPGQGVAGRVFLSGKREIVQDLRKDQNDFQFPEWIRLNGFVSLICLPLQNRRGDPRFGTIQLFVKYDHIYDPDNVQYLESIAHQISMALRSLQEKRDLRRINQFAETINAETTLTGVLQIGVRELPSILAFNRALAIVQLPSSTTFKVLASSDGQLLGELIDGSLPVAERLMTQTKVRTFRALRPRRLPSQYRHPLKTVESLVVVPISGANYQVRCAILLVNDRRDSFRSGRLKGFQRNLCQTLASQISSSVRKGELLESLKLEATRQAALQRVLRQTSSVDRERSTDILNLAVEELMASLGVDVALLGLLTKESEGLAPCAIQGLTEEEASWARLEALHTWAYLTLERKSYLWPGSRIRVFHRDDLLSEVVLLLVFHEQPIGLLALGSRREGAFDKTNLPFLETFVSGVAARIQNTIFFEAALRLGAVRFDDTSPNRICAILAEKTSEVLGTPLTSVWLRRRHGDDEILDMHGVYGADIHDHSAFALKRSEGGLSWKGIEETEHHLAKIGSSTPSFVDSLHRIHPDIQATDSGFAHQQFAREFELKSMILMPLVHDNKVLGVINTYVRSRYQFFDFEVHLLQNLALSGAMALGNAYLTERLSEINESILDKAQIANPGTVALSFSHDIGHTLSDVTALLSALIDLIPKKALDEEPGKSLLQSLTTSTDYLRVLFRSLVRYAGGKPVRYDNTSLMEILESVRYIYSIRLEKNRIGYHKPTIEEGALWIECDRNQIEQVFINLFNNSIYAIRRKMLKGGQISVSARVLDEQHIEVQFQDNGTGIPAEDLKRAFDPFFTTKGSEGNGFGLAICRRIVEDNHRGRIWIASELHESTTVYIRLPKYQ